METMLTWRVKLEAAGLLFLASLLPLYSFPGRSGGEPTFGYAWPLALEEWGGGLLIVLAFLWPLPLLVLRRQVPGRRMRVALHALEPLMAAASGCLILLVSEAMMEFRQIFWVLFLPVSADASAGAYMALVANGLFLVAWLAETLRPLALRPRLRPA
jgi:hypothetical protein